MKHRVIDSKDLDLKCISALRYLDSCDECNRVQKCELPEAVHGQLKLINEKALKTEEHLRELQEQRSKLRDKIKELPPPVWRKPHE